MKKIYLLFLVIQIVVLNPSHALLVLKGAGKKTPGPADQVVAATADQGGLNSTIKSILDRTPNIELKRAVTQYMEVLGLNKYYSQQSVGGSNRGIEIYFYSKQEKFPCFDSLQSEFKDLISRVETRRGNFPLIQEQIKTWPLNQRPSLKNTAGEGIDADLNPGWAWDAALKLANNDPNLAMSLLGSLGHDDIVVGRNSPLFIPRSLGEDVDISDKLKRQVVEAQARESKDPRYIPAKYYHVIGAAFMSCQLVQQGIEGPLAQLIESNAARMYRGLRLCEVIREFGTKSTVQQAIPQLLKSFGVSGNPTHIQEIITINTIKLINSDACLFGDRMPVCTLIERSMSVNFYSPVGGTKSDLIKAAKDAINATFAKVIAAKVFEREYIGNEEIKGKNIPCTNIKSGAALYDTVANAFDKPYFNDRSCGEHYSDESCQKGRDVLKSWMIDFDWTMEQHSEGAKFAADKCKKLKTGEDPYAKSCDALAANGLKLPAGQTSTVVPNKSDRSDQPTSTDHKIE